MGATSSSNGHVPQNREGARFRPGEIIGVYRILSLIGKGGAGEVFKVEHTLTKRIEAIKALSADHSQEAQRFLREVQIHASLSHPNIASVHNAFWAGEDLIMAMELVEGQSLRAILERGRIPLAAAIDWVCQALSALDYAHAHHVTHRDITPGNMLVTSKGTIKLTDFGLAKLPTDLRLTKTGMMVGSLYYMSPEQVRAVPDVDPRSDLYSVGAVLYEMVTGAKPFDGDSSFAIMLAQVGQDPRAPISLEPALPPGLNEIILKALAKDPCDRFQSALEFCLAVEPFRDCEGESVAKQPFCLTHDAQMKPSEEIRVDLQNTEDCQSVERTIDKPSRQANWWNWKFQFSTTGDQPGRPSHTIHPKLWIPKWRSLSIAASLLAVFGSVYATTTWQRIRLTAPISTPVAAEIAAPQQTIPVATVPPIVSQPILTALTLNMSAGNAALNDNPVPMQDGVSTQNLSDGDHTLHLARNGGKATLGFRIRAGELPEVTDFTVRNITITAVAQFGKEVRVYSSGKSNSIRIDDLSPGLHMIDTGSGADASQFQVRVGDGPSLQVFVTDPKTVDLIVASNEDDATVLINGSPSGVIRNGKHVASLSPGGYTIDVKKPGFTNPTKERVRLASGKPQTISFALVPTVANLAMIGAPDTEISIDDARTGMLSPTGILDLLRWTGQNFRPGETFTAPGNGYLEPDGLDSETVAIASFEPMGPSRLHKVLDRMSPVRVVHPREKVGFVPAKLIHAATASAPLRLMRETRGKVSADIRVTIDKNGKVTGVNPESPAEKGPLPSAAMAAAWNWTFMPARRGSNPVESQAILRFRFQNSEFASASR